MGSACSAAAGAEPNNSTKMVEGAIAQDDDDPLLDKVHVRLLRAVLPCADSVVVRVRLVDTHPFPSRMFGCDTLPDKTDLLPLVEHTFGVRRPATGATPATAVWFEDCLLLSYRPKNAEHPRATVEVSVTFAGTNVVDAQRFSVWEGSRGDSKAVVDGEWQNVTVPFPASESSTSYCCQVELAVRTERAETRFVSEERFHMAGLSHEVVPLTRGDVSGGGRAVITWKTAAANSRVFLWLPGLNASFHHVHVLEALLASGWDVFALDCRRMGRAKEHAATHDPGWDVKDAHTTGDFDEYSEEIDALVAKAMATKAYRRCVLYGNSTGALTAVTYLQRDGPMRSHIHGLAVNGPFFDWNLAAYAELVVSSPLLTDVYARLVAGDASLVEKGRGLSAYSLKVWSQYYFPAANPSSALRSMAALNTTTEWAKAVTVAQGRLKKSSPTLLPVFGITSICDAWVNTDTVMTTIDVLGPNRTEVQVANAEHDVFLSVSKQKVDECVHYLLTWLSFHFP